MEFDDRPLSVRQWGTSGWGDAAHHMKIVLPAEPAVPAIVRVRVAHPLFGADPVFLRLVENWIPAGWIPANASTWATLCGWDVDGSPQVLVEAVDR